MPRYASEKAHSRSARSTGCAPPMIEPRAIISIAARETTPRTKVALPSSDAYSRSSGLRRAVEDRQRHQRERGGEDPGAGRARTLASMNSAVVAARYSTTTSMKKRRRAHSRASRARPIGVERSLVGRCGSVSVPVRPASYAAGGVIRMVLPVIGAGAGGLQRFLRPCANPLLPRRNGLGGAP
jgi:hypothetical protein